MKVIRIKKVGKVPIGRVIAVTAGKAKEEIDSKISKLYDGPYEDGENPVTDKLKEEEIVKRLEKKKKEKRQKITKDENNQDGN